MLCTNDSLSLKKSSTYFFCRHDKKATFLLETVSNGSKVKHIDWSICFWRTFFFSGSSLYFLERILVRSRLLISGCNFAYLALFSMKKRKYGVKGFLGKSGCFCVSWAKNTWDLSSTQTASFSLIVWNIDFNSPLFSCPCKGFWCSLGHQISALLGSWIYESMDRADKKTNSTEHKLDNEQRSIWISVKKMAHLFRNLLPFLLTHLRCVGIEGHLLPVEVGLWCFVFSQVFLGQGHFHGLQQF